MSRPPNEGPRAGGRHPRSCHGAAPGELGSSFKSAPTTSGLILAAITLMTLPVVPATEPAYVMGPMQTIAGQLAAQRHAHTAGDTGRGGAGQQQPADVIAIKEDADLDLSCPIVVQNEDMIISWTCDDEPANIRSSRVHVTEGGKLRIRSAKVGDSCNYRCEAADGFGTLSVFIRVIIVDRRLMKHLAGGGGPSGGNWTRHRAEAAEWPSSEPNNNTELHQQQQQQQPDLWDIRVEPSQVRVDRNRSFTLECRVKHPARKHLQQSQQEPQIVWLKEFTGKTDEPRRASDEAHQQLAQSLVLIDDVYYHSLNWPRSVTFTRKSSSTNSALLVRQANHVHSGRYICFAGYPNEGAPLGPPPGPPLGPLEADATPTRDAHPTPPPASRAHLADGRRLQVGSARRKRMALALVQVHDPEWEALNGVGRAPTTAIYLVGGAGLVLVLLGLIVSLLAWRRAARKRSSVAGEGGVGGSPQIAHRPLVAMSSIKKLAPNKQQQQQQQQQAALLASGVDGRLVGQFPAPSSEPPKKGPPDSKVAKTTSSSPPASGNQQQQQQQQQQRQTTSPTGPTLAPPPPPHQTDRYATHEHKLPTRFGAAPAETLDHLYSEIDECNREPDGPEGGGAELGQVAKLNAGSLGALQPTPKPAADHHSGADSNYKTPRPAPPTATLQRPRSAPR